MVTVGHACLRPVSSSVQVPQRTPEPVRKAPKEKEAPPEKENPAPKETKSKTRRSRKKRAAGPPGLPIGIGALPTAQPGWLAQAVRAEGTDDFVERRGSERMQDRLVD